MSDSCQSEDHALLFFREIVEPTVRDFMANRADKRLCCLACLALASLEEHYFHARRINQNFVSKDLKKDISAYKRKLHEKNTAVKWVADIANATRHFEVTHHGIGYGHIDTIEMGECGIYQCGWPINGEEVLVGSEHQWRASELIECAMQFWRKKFGITPALDHEQ